MLISVKELNGYEIHASNGAIGKAHEFYFDDQLWVVRYLVVDTGGWLPGRRVLISSTGFGHPDSANKIFPISVTKEQVESSPRFDLDNPISRQYEHELQAHYGWPVYWEPGALASEIAMEVALGTKKNSNNEEEGDLYLRSTKRVAGYHIHAMDGEIGHLDDFVLDKDTWVIRYIVVDTHNWLPGRKILISAQWIEKLGWADSEIYVELSREIVKNSPEFDPSASINRDYEHKLHDHYGKDKYWTEEDHKIGKIRHVPS
jgi:hypothetical protein